MLAELESRAAVDRQQQLGSQILGRLEVGQFQQMKARRRGGQPVGVLAPERREDGRLAADLGDGEGGVQVGETKQGCPGRARDEFQEPLLLVGFQGAEDLFFQSVLGPSRRGDRMYSPSRTASRSWTSSCTPRRTRCAP